MNSPAACAGLDASPSREHREVTVFAININRFRNINNLHGIRIGDRVLRVTAERLVAGTRARLPGRGGSGGQLRPRDMIARLGADEFGIVCGPPALPPPEATAFAERLLRIVQNPISIGELSLRLTANVGLHDRHPGAWRRDRRRCAISISHCSEAKAVGPGKAIAWEPSLTRTGDATLLADRPAAASLRQRRVRAALPAGRAASPTSAWSAPRRCCAGATRARGCSRRRHFCHVLEETGLIVEVGCWVIHEAARQIEAWHVLYGRDMIDWVSVNVSPRQFNDPSPLLATLREVHDRGFAVHRLKLEITETTFMRNPEATHAVLADIEKLGFASASTISGPAIRR